jgi:hypothetical protein
VRAALTPLKAMAERTGCAVLLIRHLAKAKRGSLLSRGLGSVGIGGVARVGLLATQHPENPSLKILQALKNNLGPRIAYVYEIVDANGTAAVRWHGQCDVPEDAPPATPPARARDDAIAFLVDLLARHGGRLPKAEVQRIGAEHGYGLRRLQRARAAAGIQTDSHGACTTWTLGPGVT